MLKFYVLGRNRTETTKEFVWFYKIIFSFSINKFKNCGRVTSKIEKDCNNPTIIEHLLFDSSER